MITRLSFILLKIQYYMSAQNTLKVDCHSICQKIEEKIVQPQHVLSGH